VQQRGFVHNRGQARLQHDVLPPADAGANYREYSDALPQRGGSGLIAANRPVYVGADDQSAFREAEPALRTLWRRFHSEGKNREGQARAGMH